MRGFLKNRGQRGFTLVELMIVCVIGFILMIGLAVLAVYLIGAYLVVNPRPDRVYESEPSSAIVAPADDEMMAARSDSTDGIYCNCLLKDRSLCIECAVADASSLELVHTSDESPWLSAAGEA